MLSNKKLIDKKANRETKRAVKRKQIAKANAKGLKGRKARNAKYAEEMNIIMNPVKFPEEYAELVAKKQTVVAARKARKEAKYGKEK